jgi:hypothetical protein
MSFLSAGQFKNRLRHSILILSLLIGCRGAQVASPSVISGSETDPVKRSENSKSHLPEFRMTKELPDVSRRLTNWLNTCWLQAGIKELEFAHYKKTGKGLALSAEHMMMSSLHERFYRIIQGAKVISAELESGGEMNEVRQLARRYGVMPEKTWSQPANKWGQMAIELNEIALQYRQKFKEHNIQGKDTKPLLASAESHFKSLLKTYNVHQPTWFMSDGKKTSPLEFAKMFAPEDPEAYVIFLAKPHYPSKPTKEHLQTVQNGFLTSWENIEKAIVNEISSGRSVLLSVNWSDSGIRIKNGIMTVIQKPLVGHLDGHVVNIVGYRLDSKSRIERLKIENTWGRYEGSSGFYSVSWDDLKEMYVGISIPDGFNFATSLDMRGEKVLD